MLLNSSEQDQEAIILPDGRIDLIFTKDRDKFVNATLLGISTHPEDTKIAAGAVMFAISFKLLAAEYVLHASVSDLLDSAKKSVFVFFEF
jgi:hypothetical protein